MEQWHSLQVCHILSHQVNNFKLKSRFKEGTSENKKSAESEDDYKLTLCYTWNKYDNDKDYILK